VPEVAKRRRPILSPTDLADRWGYSSRWVRELVAARDFPDPADIVLSLPHWIEPAGDCLRGNDLHLKELGAAFPVRDMLQLLEFAFCLF
jgi:hypothetical protein